MSARSPRLVDLAFDRAGPALLEAVYRLGRPVQYSYLCDDLELWSVQTVYAGRPWAVEMPSAGRPLSWSVIRALEHRGVAVASLTHAAGLSATGDPDLDAALPLPETYELPLPTIASIERARARGGRVIAVGTTVVRALEGNARDHGGVLVPGLHTTDLVIEAGFVPEVVDGLLSGIHEPGESHFRLLRAFAPEAVLRVGLEHASRLGYRTHEFGDTCLALPRSPRSRT